MDMNDERQQKSQKLRAEAEKQLQRIQRLNKVQGLERLKEMDPIVFEHLTGLLFERSGFMARPTVASGDEGVDLHVSKGRETAVVQCKRYGQSVGQPVVRDLFGTMIHNEVDGAYLVTTAMITRQAREWSEGKPIHLIDGYSLIEWVNSLPQDDQAAGGSTAARSAKVAQSARPSAAAEPGSRKWFWLVLAALLLLLIVLGTFAFRMLLQRVDPDVNPPVVIDTPVADAAIDNGTIDEGGIASETSTSGGGGSTPVGAVVSTDTVSTEVVSTEVVSTEITSTESDSTNVDVAVTVTAEPIVESVAESATATPPPPTNTSIPQPTATEKPASTPIPVASGCTQAVDPQFTNGYDQELIGCATSDAVTHWSAWQPFQRGYLLWRSDTDAAYVFYDNDVKRWAEIPERWDGSSLPIPYGNPPSGLQAPERGFGYVWRIRSDLFNDLGWATDQEKGFCATVQTFEKGFMLNSNPVQSCTDDNLYNYATASDWFPVQFVAYRNGNWRNRSAVTSAAVTSAEVSVSSTSPPLLSNVQVDTQRPANHGLFLANTTRSINLDGFFGDWYGQWNPIETVVSGEENHSGRADLSGNMQVAWSEQGLYLAVQARDERHRSGPNGTDMWQGDGLEVHFDQSLSLDYNRTSVDSDDYQIGISFGPELDRVNVYRWLPFDKEGSLTIQGTAIKTDAGYNVEVLIPWSVFDVQVIQRKDSKAQSFGFNVSINDNDGDTDMQQTIASASPQRTTYDDPTEWGTLILLPSSNG